MQITTRRNARPVRRNARPVGLMDLPLRVRSTRSGAPVVYRALSLVMDDVWIVAQAAPSSILGIISHALRAIRHAAPAQVLPISALHARTTFSPPPGLACPPVRRERSHPPARVCRVIQIARPAPEADSTNVPHALPRDLFSRADAVCLHAPRISSSIRLEGASAITAMVLVRAVPDPEARTV